jgi:hypothetical protein
MSGARWLVSAAAVVAAAMLVVPAPANPQERSILSVQSTKCPRP